MFKSLSTELRRTAKTLHPARPAQPETKAA